jgi:hypothetical protein
VRVDETYREDWVDKALFGEDYEDDLVLEDDGWVPYECGNRKSEYFRSLLNVSEDGDKQDTITWTGCIHGERMVA